MESVKDINIVFVNYFMKDEILHAVASVRNDIAGCPYEVQITVSDNSQNQDGIKEALAAQFPMVRYIDCRENVGFGKGNTVGFMAAPARYYFALNPDIIIPENSRAIERVVRFMDEHPRVGGIGLKLLNTDGTLQYSCYRFDLLSMFIKPFKQIHLDEKYKWIRKFSDRLLMKDFDHNTTRPVDWVLGAAMVARQEALDQVGWFDERYFMYFEDADFCLRAKGAGFTVGTAKCVVKHNIEEHRFGKNKLKKQYLINSNKQFIKTWVPMYFWPIAYTYLTFLRFR